MLAPRATSGSVIAAWVAATAVLVGWVAWLRAAGFVGISLDDAARALIAWDFAAHPSLDPTRSSWLPVHTYLVGGLLRAAPDLDLTPRAVSLASTVTAMAALAVTLRRQGLSAWRVGALLAALASWRWTVLPAASGCVPEMPAVMWLCVAAALLDDVAGWRRASLAGVALSLACGHRYEAWFAAAAMAVAWSARRRDPRAAVALAVTASAVPLAWLWVQHQRGDALDFVQRVSAFRHRAAPLPNIAWRLARYPWRALCEAPAVWVLAAIALRRRAWEPVSLAGALAALGGLVLIDLRGAGPTHHAERALIPVVWLLAPTAARAVTSRAVWIAVLAVGVLASRVDRASALAGVPRDAVEAGRAMGRWSRATSGARWLVELDGDEFLWVEVASGAPDRAVPDRRYGDVAPDDVTLRARAATAQRAVVRSARAIEVLRLDGWQETGRAGRWWIAQRPNTWTPKSPAPANIFTSRRY